ncbi:CHAF1B [Branchiostoma lanceolatum]|uniref:CHAF1B protein n=1 Tax=Branchiostoma lanceolatum TaxID=7740 RepID=A0A8J9YPJ2_BRALA|nr:CHAF1B [Branchiostoma lanceolatum]
MAAGSYPGACVIQNRGKFPRRKGVRTKTKQIFAEFQLQIERYLAYCPPKMKVHTPEIAWHNRDPIYSLDFQYRNGTVHKLASAGVDKAIRGCHLCI